MPSDEAIEGTEAKIEGRRACGRQVSEDLAAVAEPNADRRFLTTCDAPRGRDGDSRIYSAAARVPYPSRTFSPRIRSAAASAITVPGGKIAEAPAAWSAS